LESIFHGDSTTGKTSALAVASSVWSSPKFMISWRTTANGLEIQAASRSSTLVTVDESHQIEPKALDAGVYMLLNGTAKARMNRDTSAKEVARWRVSVLSSGERSIESHLGAANIDYKAGQGVRIVDVPVSGRFGIFDDVHGAANGSLFADTLRNAAAKHYGHAGPLFVRQLIDKFSRLSLPAQLVDILKPFGDDLNAQEARVARSFALIALAGELAIKWGVLPWQQKAAHIAAMGIFNHWIAIQPRSKQSREHAEILKRVRDFIETYGACFSDIDWTPNYDLKGRLINPEPVIHERAGYWEESGNKRIYLFTAKGLEKASGSFGTRKAAEVLDEVGALTAKGSGGKRAKKRRVPDGRPMELYHIDPEKLTEGTI
jgi:putative DNA primase/helicase